MSQNDWLFVDNTQMCQRMGEHSYSSSVFMFDDILTYHFAPKGDMTPCHHKSTGSYNKQHHFLALTYRKMDMSTSTSLFSYTGCNGAMNTKLIFFTLSSL